MIRYPFLNDQVLIKNPRNGTNIVLSRDEARRLLDELTLELKSCTSPYLDTKQTPPT